jgi:cysteine-rich repeat protein
MRYVPLVVLVGCAVGTSDAPIEAEPAPDAATTPGPDAGLARDVASPVGDVSVPDVAREAAPVPAVCGDGFIDTGEVCDDGNKAGGDACSADCKQVLCPLDDNFVDPVTHHCYWRDKDVSSRGSADSNCKGKGGYLFRWSNAAERDAVYPKTLGGPGGRVWIDLTKQGADWKWGDGSVATDLNWRSGEPSGDGTCAEWRDGNGLNDVPCSADRDFVCERPPPGKKR